MDSIAQLNAFSVFLAIAAVGFLFLMISLFFGGIFDHFDGALDHDLDHGGPGFFSTRVISVFVTAFGGFGAIATHYGFGPLPASGIGALSGVVLATPIYCSRAFSTASRRAPTAAPRISSVRSAASSIAIPAGGSARCAAGSARN